MYEKDAQPTKDGEEVEITAVVKTLMDGFAMQDANAFSSVFANDADCIIRDGQHLGGIQIIRDTHAQIFKSIYSEGTTSDYKIESIRFLTADISLVRIRGHMEFSKDGKKAEVNGCISLVLKLSEGRWKIALFQNTSVMSKI